MFDIGGAVAGGVLLAALTPAPPVEPPQPTPLEGCVVPIAQQGSRPGTGSQPQCPAPDPRPPVSCTVPVSHPAVPARTLVVPHDCPRFLPTPEGRFVPISR